MRAASEPNIRYTFAGQTLTLDQYLERQPVTGFLIAKGDTILVERYQYARTDKHRLTSFSMAKTITALLMGIAVKEGAIRSIDDLAEIYVPDLKGTNMGGRRSKPCFRCRRAWPSLKCTGTRRAISGRFLA